MNIPNSTPSNIDPINIRELLLKYLRNWYWFVISAVLCFAVAFVYLQMTNNQYQVQTTILLRKDASSSGLLDMSMLEGLGVSASSKEVDDEIQVLTSKSIMLKVIESLGIETEYYEKTGLKYEELYPDIPFKLIVPRTFNDTLKNQVELLVKWTDSGYHIELKYGKKKGNYVIQDINTEFNTIVGKLKFQQYLVIKKDVNYKIISYPKRGLNDNYCKGIKVAPVNKKANAINVSTISSCPKKSQDILNKLIELYNLDAIIDKNLIASNTAAFVDERLKLISSELLDVELNVESYKKKNSLTDIASEAEIFLKSSSEYDKMLAELETQLNLIGYIENYVKDNKNQYNLVPANLGIEDKSLITLMQEYNMALLERMKVMRTTNDQNPVIMQMEQQLKQLRSSIIVSIGSLKDGLKIAKRDVLGKNAQFSSKIKDVPTQERQFIEIKRQQEIKEKLYLFLLQKREENAMSLASTIPSAKTVDAAFTSVLPVAPRRMIIFLLSLILGVVLPIVVIYVSDILNNKITDKSELKKLLKVPFLGSIGFNKDYDRIVVREGKTSPIVEMFRLIRTNMQFMISGKKSPVILVTSSIAGEGKSFTSINMAMSFALLKKKVILIGLDVRNPMLEEYMHIPKDKGITLFLSDPNYNTHNLIVPSGFHPFLSVIPAGPVPPNPAELLMSPRLDELIDELKNEFDYIILDSAPVGIVSDTYLLNRLVDNTIYVTRQNYTPREMAGFINDTYENKRLNNMAVVLNGTKENLGYGYGYGSGYGKNYLKKEEASLKRKLYNRLRNKE